MPTIVAVAVCLAYSIGVGTIADYCSGYRQGFTAAYCQGHPYCQSAPVPGCPRDGETWQEGYDRGYSDGERAHPGHG